MSENFLLDFKHACIVGKTTCGKSWLAREIVKGAPNFIAIDPDEDYIDISETVIYPEVDYNYLETIRNIALSGENIKISVVTENIDVFNVLVETAFHLENILLVIDEAHEFLSSQKIPEDFRRLSRRGAKRGVQILAVSQRTTELNRNFVSQCNLVISFKQSLPADIKYLEQNTRNKLNNVLPKLPPWCYICIWNDNLLSK